jgi:hypothetical protein
MSFAVSVAQADRVAIIGAGLHRAGFCLDYVTGNGAGSGEAV